MLKPPQHDEIRYIKVEEIRAKSGSERTTMAIYLYCMLVQYRLQIRGSPFQRRHSHVLILDNSIGQSSKVEHVKIQVSNASMMDIQLIYAAGGSEVNAYESFLNIIGLHNEWEDESGNKIVEVRGSPSIVGGNISKNVPVKGE